MGMINFLNREKATEKVLSKEVERLTRENDKLSKENEMFKKRIDEIDKIRKEYETIIADAKRYKDKARKISSEIEKLKEVYKNELIRLVGHKIDLDIDEDLTVDDIDK